MLVLAGFSTALGIVLGVAVGLTAAYSRGKLDDLLMRGMDVLLRCRRSSSHSYSRRPSAPSCGSSCSP